MIKCEACRTFYGFFAKSVFYKFNNTGAGTLVSIYQTTLKRFCAKTARFCGVWTLIWSWAHFIMLPKSVSHLGSIDFSA